MCLVVYDCYKNVNLLLIINRLLTNHGHEFKIDEFPLKHFILFYFLQSLTDIGVYTIIILMKSLQIHGIYLFNITRKFSNIDKFCS